MLTRFMKSKGVALTLLLAIFLVNPGQKNADAQSPDRDVPTDQGRYQNQLLELSGILGKLHHVRGECVSGERQLWRDNMMELVRLENPPASRKDEMVEGFNSAYSKARSRHPACNKHTRSAAVQLAEDGELLSRSIARNVAR